MKISLLILTAFVLFAGAIVHHACAQGTAYYLPSPTTVTTGSNDSLALAGHSSLNEPCAPHPIPFSENFDGVTSPNLPPCWSEVHAFAKPWVIETNITSHANHNSIVAHCDATNPEDNWFFTPALILEAGKHYNVKFKYKGSGHLGVGEKLEVQWGTAASVAGMTSDPVFDNPDIQTSDYVQGTGVINPITTGNYYVGWHAYNAAHLGSISVTDIEIFNSYTWTGEYDDDWGKGSNWSFFNAPTYFDDVIISLYSNNPPVIREDPNTPAICHNLTIQEYASLTIAPGKALTVTGTLTNNNCVGCGGLAIQSDASGTGSLIANNAVSAVVQRYVPAGGWHLISAPVTELSILNFLAENNFITMNPDPDHSDQYGLAPYDNTIPNWLPYTTGTIETAGDFAAAKGYEILLNFDATTQFRGRLFVDAMPCFISNPGGTGNAWNLIGNPYSSAIRATDVANSFLSQNEGSLDPENAALYVWDGASYTPINNTTGPTYIQSGQGFFVKSRVSFTAVIFYPSFRAHNAAPFHKSGEALYPHINLKADIAGKNRHTDIYFMDDATAGLDPGYDAGMFDGTGTDNTVYTQMEGSETGFAIQGLPNNLNTETVIPVGLTAAAGATVAFTAETMDLPSGVKVYLHDVAANTYTRLDEPGSSYQVNLAEASSGIGRYYLVASPYALSTDKPLVDLYTVIPVPSKNLIHITGSFEPGSQAMIYSVNGQLLYSGKLYNPGENEIRFAPSASGIYMLRIQGSNGLITKKINWVY